MTTSKWPLMRLITVVWVVGSICIFNASPASAQAQRVTIGDLKQNAATYAGQRVIAIGKLRFVGTNYFRDPRFVIVDETGNEIPVTAWVPLEVPPLPPDRTVDRPRVMSDYLDKRLAVTGTFQRNAPERNEDRIQVESVAEEVDQRAGGGATADVASPMTGVPSIGASALQPIVSTDASASGGSLQILPAIGTKQPNTTVTDAPSPATGVRALPGIPQVIPPLPDPPAPTTGIQTLPDSGETGTVPRTPDSPAPVGPPQRIPGAA